MTSEPAILAARLLPLIDLTSLNDAQDDDIAELCRAARTPHGTVAALCSWPAFVGKMRNALEGNGIGVAAVVNFPEGVAPLSEVLAEAKSALEAGADELDLVWPYRAWLAGETGAACDQVAAVKRLCEGRARLKVILESAELGNPERVLAASRDAIAAGADFIKTSTGKLAGGASPAAAEAMLQAIEEAGGHIGFKASGGIRSLEDAGCYLSLAEERFGLDWPTAERFRIGASRLLGEILEALDEAPAAATETAY